MATEKQKVVATLTKAEPSTHLVVESDCETLDVFGPSVQFLVAPQGSDEAPCVSGLRLKHSNRRVEFLHECCCDLRW
jgi:hypothetical protein